MILPASLAWRRLYFQDGATRCTIDAEFGPDGALTLIGQDVGEAPREWWATAMTNCGCV